MVTLNIRTSVEVPGDDFTGLCLVGMHLPELELENRDCTRSNFTDTSMPGAECTRANFTECLFISTNLITAEMEHVVAHRANFQRANLSLANLGDADLSYASFVGANLRKASFRNTTLTGAVFDPEHLPDAWKTLPTVPDLPEKILEALGQPQNHLTMCEWHLCDTAHCLAGWATFLTLGSKSKVELDYGTPLVGAGLFYKAIGFIPDFYCTDEEALAWLVNFVKSRAEKGEQNAANSERQDG